MVGGGVVGVAVLGGVVLGGVGVRGVGGLWRAGRVMGAVRGGFGFVFEVELWEGEDSAWGDGFDISI